MGHAAQVSAEETAEALLRFSEKRMLAARQKGTPAESVDIPDVLLQDVFGGLLRNGACSTSGCGGNR